MINGLLEDTDRTNICFTTKEAEGEGWGRELVLVLFIRLFDLHLFGFACFFFPLVSGIGCGL